MATDPDFATQWWRAPELQGVFRRLDKAASTSEPAVCAVLEAHGLRNRGWTGYGGARSPWRVLRRQDPVSVLQNVQLSDGREVVVESDGTLLITTRPVTEYPYEVLRHFNSTTLYNATSPSFVSLAAEIEKRGLEGVGLRAGETWYVLAARAPDDESAFTWQRMVAYDDARPAASRRAFDPFASTVTLARDVANLAGIRQAMGDVSLQHHCPMFTPPSTPRAGSGGLSA